MSPVLRQMMCDCYTDTIRVDFTPTDLEKIDPVKAKKLTVKLIEKCNQLMQPQPGIAT